VREYAEAWKEQRTERAVIVWMAESYIHVGESTRYGWFIARVNSPRANRYKLLRRASLRFILIHAMTSYGSGADAVTPEDYHDTLDSAKFVLDGESSVIPASKVQRQVPPRAQPRSLVHTALHVARR